MAVTYSQAVTGASAESESLIKNYTLPDQAEAPSGTVVAATLGGQSAAMRQNLPLLVKKPDGSSGWYVLDSERSTPSVPVLRAL